MSESRTNVYEGMFLISQAEAAMLGEVIDHIKDLLERAGAELIAMKKWDERRLAYEIDKQRRGVYILTYFRAPAENMTQLDRECNLSERIMRVMVLRADHLSEDQMKAADAMQELLDEAKMRAAKAAERDAIGQGSGVTMGAPVAADAKVEETVEAETSDEKVAEPVEAAAEGE